MRMQKQVDTIVHIGAGRCGEFEEYKAAGAKRIVLIEPDPESARYLRHSMSSEKNVEIVERAVTTTEGSDQLRLYNVRGYSSLREPTGLRELYPGLRQVGEVYSDTWSPRQMCEELGIENNENNWLIVDAPGEEGSIMEYMRGEGLLDSFDTVSLYAGFTSLYEGNLTADKILSEMDAGGYEVLDGENDKYSERPRWNLYRDEINIRNKELEERLLELSRKYEETTEEKKRLEKEVGDLKKELESESRKRKDVEEERNSLSRKYEEVVSQKKDLEKRISEMHEHNIELQIRQSKINEELIKGDAQIGLIKELLLPQFNEGYKIDK